jgi:Ca2+-binding RTX toxin-like protein
MPHGELNSPWGMVQATANFGQFSNALLVGNFGNGLIHAYDIHTGALLGTLSEAPGKPLVIDGLWGLAFGNGVSAGDANSLYYAAGPDHEAHGLFGKITANAAGTNPVTTNLKGSDLIITGSRDSDFVTVDLSHGGQTLTVRAGGQVIGTFDAAAVGTIHFTGFAGDDVFLVDPRVTATVFADGGAGNDVLTTAAGGGVLLGGPGDDVLIGGSGRNILIGGDGHDRLFAGSNQDILIGGSTKYDGDPVSLDALFQAWNGPGSYNDRVAAIRAGTNGVPKLDATTVIDDGVRDSLYGGPSLDWFFATPPDRVHHLKSDEFVN